MTADMAQAHRSDGKSIDILGREISPEPRPPTTRSRHYGKIVRDAFSRGTRQALAARWLAPKLERMTGVDDGRSPASPRPSGSSRSYPSGGRLSEGPVLWLVSVAQVKLARCRLDQVGEIR